jgi:hypothetical protein
MNALRRAALLLVLLGTGSTVLAQGLDVTQSGPRGEVSEREEANEVRVVFSEPMVALGAVPATVTAPFFHIEPAVAGAFRWSGTRTLIFTPREPLPWATRFEVTVDTTAVSAAGRKLARPHTFSFTTPTLKLLSTEWYRKGGRHDAPVVIGLRFNQPVDPGTLARNVSLRYEPHEIAPPPPPPTEPEARAAFEAKLQQAREAANRQGSLGAPPTTSFDTERLEPGDDLLVLQTETAPPPDAWIRVEVGTAARGKQGAQAPANPQSYTVELDPTFFVNGLTCTTSCDPDSWNPVAFRSEVSAEAFRAKTRVADVTDPASPRPLQKSLKPETVEEGEYDTSRQLTLQDAGYSLRPARTYEVTIDRGLVAADGQTLGYTWTGTVQHWHQRAFTSFGAGHGVWEASGGPKLPFHARNLRDVTQWLAPVTADELMPTLRRLQDGSFEIVPEGKGTPRPLTPRADTIQSYGIDLAGALGPAGTGVVWAGLKDGRPIARAHHESTKPKATLVQVTNLGLSVKDSPHGTLALVTRLADAKPVEGATVSIRNLQNTVLWTGTTDRDGIALAPALNLRPDDT